MIDTVPELINVLLIAGGIGVCGLCFMQITSSLHLRKEVRRYFQVFFVLIVFYVTAHLVRRLMEGAPGGGVQTALYVITFAEMFSAGLMAHMMSLLVLVVSKAPEKTAKRVFIGLYGILALHVALLAVFNVNIFYFTDANEYTRGALYLLSNLSPFIMLVVDMVMLIKYRKNIDRYVKTAFWNYMIAPVVAMVIQAIYSEIQFIIFATVGAAVYMFAIIMKNQNEQFAAKMLENSRIETELNMASRIQADMVPNIYPAFPDREEFDIYATMDPAKEVGGDFYDFFLIDDDHLCMVMADVSGKGVPAALFMMASKIILANNAMMGKSPAQILHDTNASICSHNREEMFVTVWLGILEISTGKLTAANAGHEFPVLKNESGAYELVKDKHGFVIGGMEGAKYKEYELTLTPGSKLFLYTDGIPEATDAEGKMFGLENMVATLNGVREDGPVDTLKGMKAAVDGFVKNAEQFDDLTMLCMEYKGRRQ